MLSTRSQMLGTADTTFVREVSFLVPSGTPPPPTFKPKTTQHINHVDDWQQPPKLVLASTNLTLATFMQCRESITYLPHPWPSAPPPILPPAADNFPALDPADVPHADPKTGTPPLPPQTLFTQSALIFSAGSLAAERYPPHGINEDSPVAAHTYPAAGNFVQRGAGAKIEQWGKDRFEMNADKGRDAMRWAGNKWAKVWRAEEDKQRRAMEVATVAVPKHAAEGGLDQDGRQI